MTNFNYLESLYWGKSDGFGNTPQGGGLAKTLLTDGSLALIFSLGDNNDYARQFKGLITHEPEQ